ncbi:hypothetical protein [Levilactobacillus parabrevis]|uniref:hypothetical protein n=1 Tax=Levilactobacillus parabrevis TaxID=357278 RepID=UPI0021A47683|nr:hypothetical protein [Levilactobacillus parabrevis]
MEERFMDSDVCPGILDYFQHLAGRLKGTNLKIEIVKPVEKGHLATLAGRPFQKIRL